jgi:hypothetical protein
MIGSPKLTSYLRLMFFMSVCLAIYGCQNETLTLYSYTCFGSGDSSAEGYAKASYAIFPATQTVVKLLEKEDSLPALGARRLEKCDVYDRSNWACEGNRPSGVAWWIIVSNGKEDIDDLEEYVQNKDAKIGTSGLRYWFRWVPAFSSRDKKECLSRLAEAKKRHAELKKSQ